MTKWKLQAVEPDTCSVDVPARQLESADPQSEGAKGCRYIELWDVDVDPLVRMHSIAAFERVCPAHDDGDIPEGLLLWADGNWKPLAEYIEYQRAWFRHLNFVEWNTKSAAWVAANPNRPARFNPYADMPPQIRPFAQEPQTTGSRTPPAQSKRDALTRVYGWNKDHNARKNNALNLLKMEGADETVAEWSFAGHGNGRVLTVSARGQLNSQQRGRVRSVLDIQFGPGKVVVRDD